MPVLRQPFFGTLGQPGEAEATCVLGIHGASENAVARLVVSRRDHTQNVLYRLAEGSRLYEPHTSMLALGALQPGDIALDIGAHVGYFTTLFRLAVGAGGRVFAFEPLADTYRRLLHNVLINGFANVLPLPLAVADRSGTAYFHVNEENEGESSLFAESGPAVGPVQVTSLDDLFREDLPLRPRLLKIDVEGAEMSVLNGAAAWFERQGPDMVIIEINRGALERSGTSAWDIRRFFERRGYRGAAINGAMPGQGVGDAPFRYYDRDFPAVPEDYGYVFNEMYVRAASGLYPPSSPAATVP
ncbi:MAG TPA: FkbM family methyltransferase [Azonexus sp.]|nr:FkbM family methyltransferase [Azonexus sp.]